DDTENVLVGDDVLGVGHADVGLGLVVERYQLDLPAGLFEVALELLDGQLRAELDALTECGLAARERALGCDLDRAFALGIHWGGRSDEAHGERQAENQDAADEV